MSTPPQLTTRQRRIVVAIAVFIAVTRLFAVAHSLLDWDEALFSLGVRDYDVARHQPHPPGYPLFVAAGKLVHLTGLDEFRSLQTVVVLSSLFLFPALFMLARELGFDWITAAGGAALFAFLPNVWVYGGTAFSDIPGAVLSLFAAALLMRGRREDRAYLAGAIVLGIAAGIRPAALLVGAAPALIATFYRLRAHRFGYVVAAILAGGVIAAGSYAGAALASSGIDEYVEAVRSQSKWVHDVDSWHSPDRPPLPQAAKTFLVHPFGNDALDWIEVAGIMSLLAALVLRRAAPLLVVLTFAPIAVTSWLNLDINTPARYAIAYLPGYALLAADGLRVVFRRSEIQAFACFVLIAVLAVWTWPALHEQRSADAPPVAALKWVARNVPVDVPLYVHGGYRPHAQFLLTRHHPHFFDATSEVPPAIGAWVVDVDLREGARNFARRHARLWRIIRRRGFEASVAPRETQVTWGSGWYEPEGEAPELWRWMGREGRVTIPPGGRSGKLRLRLYVPLDALPQRPNIDVMVNGERVARLTPASAEVEQSWIVPSHPDRSNELRITTDTVVIPAQRGLSRDARTLGLRVNGFSWTPIP